jgi:putative (di)nucleoside polyphosphate hydrolase
MTEDEILALPYRPCVGVVLANRQGNVFAGQRVDNPHDAWQMPQGGIDKGEQPNEAAVRELWEETGVGAELIECVTENPDWVHYDLPFDLVPKIWNGRFRGQQQKWFLFRFLGDDGQINIETEHPEFRSWAWMPPSELIERIVPFKQSVYRDVFAAFSGELAALSGR